MMIKISQENKSAPFPVKKSDFKPRVDKNTCQYCRYTSNFPARVNEHVNSQHEMQEWFKCKICKYVTLDRGQIKLHLRGHHKLELDGAEIRKLIVKDQKEILKHKNAMIKRRNLKMKIDKKPEFNPIDKDSFKPRKDPKICQYCNYKSNKKFNVDEHVNVNHELNRWYQCNHCPHATLYSTALRKHVLTIHKQKLTFTAIKNLIIDNDEKTDHLKRLKIQEKKFSEMPLEERIKESKFIPIDNSDFKPRNHPLICQYCGFIGNTRRYTNDHVNSSHELTTWFKCDECDYATLFSRNLRQHLKNQHMRRNVNLDKVKKLLVKDKKEIVELKKKWTEKNQAQKIANEHFSKMLQDRQIRKKSKSMAIDKADFKPRIYPRICQYCGFTTKCESATDRHVNNFHEMTDWYKCEFCDHASLRIDGLRKHLKSKHSKDLSKDRPESCLIKDQEVIDRLRNKKIQFKKSREELSVLLPEQLSNEPKYLPVDKVDFKPRINLNICQYCGFSRRDVNNINVHVNIRHEMMTWYRCAKCNHVTLSSSQLRNHLRKVHSEKNITQETLMKCIVKNQKEIDLLKKLKIEKINNLEKQAKLKSELVEKIRPMIPSVFKFKPRIDPNTCQYCGHFSQVPRYSDDHVNTQHEMIIWNKCSICGFSSTGSLKRHMSMIHKKPISYGEISVITDLNEIIQLRKNRFDKSPRKTSFGSDSCASDKVEELPTDLCDDEDGFQSERDGGSDANTIAPTKLKALSIVLERLKTPMTKDYRESGNDKIKTPSTGDVKKEETLLEIEESRMEDEHLLENEYSVKYDKDALDELDEEWLVGPSW